MTSFYFDNMLEKIFAVFGKSSPGAGVKKHLLEVCEHIPDKAAKYISDKFEELDSCPTNIGKCIRTFYGEWRAENNVKTYCGACENGWVWVQEKGKAFPFCVPCQCVNPETKLGEFMRDSGKYKVIFAADKASLLAYTRKVLDWQRKQAGIKPTNTVDLGYQQALAEFEAAKARELGAA